MDNSIEPSSIFGKGGNAPTSPRNDYNQSVHEKFKGVLKDLGLQALEDLVRDKYNDENLMEAGYIITQFNETALAPIELDNHSTYLYCVAVAMFEDVFNTQERREKLNLFAYEMHFYGSGPVSYPSEVERVFAIQRNFTMMFILRNLKHFKANY